MISYVSDVYPENFVFQIFTIFLNFVKITLLFSIFYCLSWLYFEFLNFKRAVLIVCRILFLNKALEQRHYISNVRYIAWFLYYIMELHDYVSQIFSPQEIFAEYIFRYCRFNTYFTALYSKKFLQVNFLRGQSLIFAYKNFKRFPWLWDFSRCSKKNFCE